MTNLQHIELQMCQIYKISNLKYNKDIPNHQYIKQKYNKILPFKPAYGWHMSGCHPLAGGWLHADPTKALWAYSDN